MATAAAAAAAIIEDEDEDVEEADELIAFFVSSSSAGSVTGAPRNCSKQKKQNRGNLELFVIKDKIDYRVKR